MLSNIYKYIPIWFGGTAYKRFKSRITNYTCQRGNPYLGRDKNRFLVDGFIDAGMPLFREFSEFRGSRFWFPSLFNFFRGSISFQTKKNCIKIGWLDRKFWRKMCKITWKTSVLLYSALLFHFSLLLVILTPSLLPFSRGYALRPPFLPPLPCGSASFQRNQSFACGMPVDWFLILDFWF